MPGHERSRFLAQLHRQRLLASSWSRASPCPVSPVEILLESGIHGGEEETSIGSIAAGFQCGGEKEIDPENPIPDAWVSVGYTLIRSIWWQYSITMMVAIFDYRGQFFAPA
jgi:creatinine amidohydrolase/Fe(II)-dependent formamide hydrolase-like protein